MEANGLLFLGVAVALLGIGGGAGSVGIEGTPRDSLRDIYRTEVGIREATGRNDGLRVAEYLRYCGLGGGYEWCAAFVSWCHGQAGYPHPRNAWAAALFPANKTIWSTEQGAPSILIPKEGDVFGIYIASKKRIGHCGFIDGWDGKWCITVEGNVDNAVVRKRRLISTIRAVSRWQHE